MYSIHLKGDYSTNTVFLFTFALFQALKKFWALRSSSQGNQMRRGPQDGQYERLAKIILSSTSLRFTSHNPIIRSSLLLSRLQPDCQRSKSPESYLGGPGLSDLRGYDVLLPWFTLPFLPLHCKETCRRPMNNGLSEGRKEYLYWTNIHSMTHGANSWNCQITRKVEGFKIPRWLVDRPLWTLFDTQGDEILASLK